MNELMLHCGSDYVKKNELKAVLTPTATRTWHPVPHYDVAELVTNEAASRGYRIINEQYGLNPSGTKMFAVLRFHPEGRPDMARSLGFRNSHDKSLALGLTVGFNIVVCQNLVFAGERTIHRKHTSCIEIDKLVPEAFDTLDAQYEVLEERINEMKFDMLSIDDARLVTVKVAEAKAIPSCDILGVLNEFNKPRHEEFKEPSRWSLYNAFTETAKKYSPARADKCYRGLARIFKLD
jgi:hypothetical protein